MTAFTPKALHITAQGREQSERTLGEESDERLYSERVTHGNQARLFDPLWRTNTPPLCVTPLA